jgi:hypothetical protein
MGTGSIAKQFRGQVSNASAINSGKEFTGSMGETAIAMGTSPTNPIGTKSFTLNARLG